jgi:conjugal transfer pilus assembly protein TraU
MTEIDPTWNDDTLAALVYPETVVFDFPLAQVACAADCVAATCRLAARPALLVRWLQWLDVPMTGNIGNSDTMDQSMRLAAERMVFKMHRTALAWGTMGDQGLCGKYIMPIMRSSNTGCKWSIRWRPPPAATPASRPVDRPPSSSPLTPIRWWARTWAISCGASAIAARSDGRVKDAQISPASRLAGRPRRCRHRAGANAG